MLFIPSPRQSAMRIYEAAQTFSQISSRFQAFSRHIKEVLEVYFRIREFHQARTKKKKSYKGKILVHYSLNDWAFLWVGGCVLGETSLDVSRGNLSMAPKALVTMNDRKDLIFFITEFLLVALSLPKSVP